MKKIRLNTFETNSSSAHTFVFSKKYLEKVLYDKCVESDIKNNITNGRLKIETDDYLRGFGLYVGYLEKLKFIIADIYDDEELLNIVENLINDKYNIRGIDYDYIGEIDYESKGLVRLILEGKSKEYIKICLKELLENDDIVFVTMSDETTPTFTEEYEIEHYLKYGKDGFKVVTLEEFYENNINSEDDKEIFIDTEIFNINNKETLLNIAYVLGNGMIYFNDDFHRFLKNKYNI